MYKRHFGPVDEASLLNALEEARYECCHASGKVEIGSELYKALNRLTLAIDDVVEATGRPRTHFWAATVPITSKQ